ncbi:hypothetical protein ACVIGB_008676 [Bradyrhizobium sp. USDA 4341]
MIAIAAAILIFLWFDYDRDIAKAAIGVRRIEDRVNKFAGEELLHGNQKRDAADWWEST